MNIGIDKINFFSPNLYLDMVDLAEARGEDPNKYLIGIGQTQQAVIPATQDIVTMAANAADAILTDEDRENIEEIIVATESGIDQSKSAAVYVQSLLGLNKYARTIEMKQACYAGTYGLMHARDFVAAHPDKKVLVIATDIARYGLETGGEVTQGGGAVAMLVSANPRIMTINQDSVYMTADIMDFWRPNYTSEAVVDGKFSANIYRDFFGELWARYKDKNNLSLTDMSAFVYHLPFTKMGLKALRDILPEVDEDKQAAFLAAFEDSRAYNQQVGNLYTGSTYLSLLSLLENTKTLEAGDRIGIFSYGSGAEGEVFTVTLQPEFKSALPLGNFADLLANRRRVTVAEYEKIFKSVLSGSQDRELDVSADSARFVLAGLKEQQRQYLDQND
ncbi:hydroxymethylglutaryl-CoA synthase [Weissella tructae]|uniref:Hydroxymethylglutaryl-CoA synthase n=2 Tax=Weissella TaxID=46255 RepID=A0A075U592_9LACO|nr:MULTISPECIES: hydroxymethylglutaryl-CoA synthase [Weissella]AIG65302.1 Hydroxymethylglutaryl-CoA synthase [Weissella tructae]AIM62616.1 Hydroxymethylglutaryl-CoA synthase [Weissella ceti]AIM63951.1 Hydroxymethylglutaryl-CoA synthase [Weissella ceti]ELA07707.1 3-hydroxy-3-methylglutaryl CoA synthase [Weissella ceti NC36]QVV91684.1 hydroxymethylglutaryl-CoA synthase [Weissella tructae]